MKSPSFPMPNALSFLLVVILLMPVDSPARADEPQTEISVPFREIHRDGNVKIIGHFGIPIGTTIKIEGVRAQPSKLTNKMTLHVHKVNGKNFIADERYSPFIQIANVGELPETERIVLEGYESIEWRGDPERNWHINVPFVVTKVIAPESLKRNLKLPR